MRMNPKKSRFTGGRGERSATEPPPNRLTTDYTDNTDEKRQGRWKGLVGIRATKDQSVVLLRAFHTRNFWDQKSYGRQTEDEPRTNGFYSVFPRFDSCKNVEFDAVAASPRWSSCRKNQV